MTHAHPTTEAVPCPVCDKTPTPAGPEVVHAEPLTHCEWCGAEYPQPEDVPPTATPARHDPATEG
jgi:hypothetical protein